MEEKKLDWKLGVIIVLGILILLSIQKCTSNAYKLDEKEDLIKSMGDTLKTWVDKDGNHRAKISTLETAKAKDFINMQTKDLEILRLQDVVRKNKDGLKNGGSATIITTEGTFTYKGGKPTITWNKPMTIQKPCDTIYPIYSKEITSKDKWIWGNMRMSKDSSEFNVKYRDSMDIVLGREKTGFLGLGKGKPFGDMTSYNPYTEIKEFRTYNVTDKTPPKKFGLGLIGGYGFGTGSVLPQFFVGVGGSYNLIRF